MDTLLRGFNAAVLEPTELLHPEQTLHGVLEHWAAIQPDAPALVYEARTWPSHGHGLLRRQLKSRAGVHGAALARRHVCLEGRLRQLLPAAGALSRAHGAATSTCTMWPQESVLSYGELDRRTNQLAHRLIALGVGADVPAGVMIPRSLDAIVAVLGVLKAGGAFIPMDPSYPSDRLAMMLEDSQVSAPPSQKETPWVQACCALNTYIPRAQAPVLLSQAAVFGEHNLVTKSHVLLVRFGLTFRGL